MAKNNDHEDNESKAATTAFQI